MKYFISISLFVSVVLAIWPIPVQYEHGDTVLWISENVTFKWAGTNNVESLKGQNAGSYDFQAKSNVHLHFEDDGSVYVKHETQSVSPDGLEPAAAAISGDDMVEFALKSAWKTIFKNSFVPWKFHPRSWKEPDPAEATYISEVQLKLLKKDPENVAKPLAGDVDESYTLSLTEKGIATISANSSVGIVRGLNSFTQLFFQHSTGGIYTPLAPVTIFDAPKFQHRGLNLDVSRNWFTISDIKRTIEAAAYNKLNRFHLHITDAQSWPLEIPALPELAAKGAYRPDLVYTPNDFKDIQYFAAIRGVELITEIDMPGHTSSIHWSYPDLVVAFNEQPNWNDYAAEPPSGTLKLNSTAVYDFLQKLFDDLLPRIHPYSSYFHTGGDEIKKEAYLLDDTVRSKDPAVLQPLVQIFIDRAHDHIRSLGLTPIVWEEMLVEWNLTLGKDVIVQGWRSDEVVAEIVGKGYKALVGNYNYWYLDCGKGDWLNYDQTKEGPYLDYCGPYHNWRHIYSFDPLNGIPADKQHLVIGGETHMWAEQTDPFNMDGMIWPRAAAAAEVLWSGAKDEQGRNRSQIDAAPRLSEMRERLLAKGVKGEPIQMPYCTMEGNVCEYPF